MESKKPAASSSPSSAQERCSERDELYGRRKEMGPSSTSDIIRTVFPEPSKGVGFASDLFGSLRKQGPDGQAWNGQSKTSGVSSQGSPSKGHGIPNKDKHLSNDAGSIDTWNFSSSLYYGGQDFCSNYPSTQSSGAEYTHKLNEEEEDNSNMASRGNWWQGSLYY